MKIRFSRLGNLWFALLIVLTFLILSTNFLNGRVSLREGEIAPSNVYYFGAATTFVSETYTEQAQNLAAGEVEQVYKYDDNVIVDLQVQIDSLFDALHAVRISQQSDAGRLLALNELLTPAAAADGDAVPPDAAVVQYFAALDDAGEDRLRNVLKNAVVAGYGLGDFDESALPQVVEQCRANVRSAAASADAAAFMLQTMEMLDFRATHVFDRVATMEAVAQAISGVQPISVTVYPGQQVITRGEQVTASDIEILEACGLQQSDNELRSYIGLALLVTICYSLLQLYCTKMSGDNQISVEKISLIALLFVAILLIGRVITLMKFDSDIATDWMLGLAIPVPAFAMLIAALVNKRTAIFATLIVSIFIGIMCGAHMLYVFAALVGGLVGVLQVRNMDSRSRYAVAAAYIIVSYALVVVSWCLMWNYDISALGIGLLMSVINGVASVILAVGTLPLLESAFSITTEIRLMELSNLNHPLLKKLMIEAPGTYNHSILVGNLAEAAADQIGANGLVVRVASYFHDIGKTKRPYFFVENQKVGDNPHDKLQPSLSTLIITSHTKEGAEMAEKHKLPTEIIDIIEQHHGTGLVKGFYNKALENAKATGSESPVREDDFRYPGPIPQTKEAALVMLADSCQAAVQSMTAPTPGQIEGMVRDIIKGKLDEGQLDQCALTFRDLDVIASIFATILAGANHYRLPYPEQLAKELAKERRQGADKDNGDKENGDKEDSNKTDSNKEDADKEGTQKTTSNKSTSDKVNSDKSKTDK